MSVTARRGAMQRLFDRIMLIAAGRNALWVLALVSFTEASFFPIPPDPVLAAIVLARRERWLAAALVCTVASVVGGLFGYAIGAGLYEAIGRPVIAFYHLEEAFNTFQQRFNEWGAWIIVAKGFTPIPFKLVTIASGVVHMDLTTFTVSALLTRGARFLIVAALFWAFGPQARAIIDRHFNTVMIAGILLIVLGFVAVVYI
ncbi:YqaA family protein [Prosthecomicrobium pneumaticum]|uniref:Membrane protein YqaA with SNARE-associated domain n=1 Tax=Prosthecomicrobium pneumaticum TaxID=81895 RepID=A0A7W9FL89_9HYPH|nr:YqaA family protein [Prosthecomicrobium pneumaticum]MBB5752683.1 membrane protein YqaA with SNARE-associated domain [Prosthecomicrobium pneumaticum]